MVATKDAYPILFGLSKRIFYMHRVVHEKCTSFCRNSLSPTIRELVASEKETTPKPSFTL